MFCRNKQRSFEPVMCLDPVRCKFFVQWATSVGPVWKHSKICRAIIIILFGQFGNREICRTIIIILFGQFGNTEICRTEQCWACLETNFDQSFGGCGCGGRKESITVHTKASSLRIALTERSMKISDRS